MYMVTAMAAAIEQAMAKIRTALDSEPEVFFRNRTAKGLRNCPRNIDDCQTPVPRALTSIGNFAIAHVISVGRTMPDPKPLMEAPTSVKIKPCDKASTKKPVAKSVKQVVSLPATGSGSWVKRYEPRGINNTAMLHPMPMVPESVTPRSVRMKPS